MPVSDRQIRATLQRLAGERAGDATFCPSEAARALTDDWRPLMPRVRTIAQELVDAGGLVCTQRGETVQPATARGAIRLRARRD